MYLFMWKHLTASSRAQSGHWLGTQSGKGCQSLPTLFPSSMPAHSPAGRLIADGKVILSQYYSILNSITLRKHPSPSRGTSPKVGVLQMLPWKEGMHLLRDKPLHPLLMASCKTYSCYQIVPLIYSLPRKSPKKYGLLQFTRGQVWAQRKKQQNAQIVLLWLLQVQIPGLRFFPPFTTWPRMTVTSLV